MRIWVDLANSPQVLFFRPILSELEQRGHDVFITSRDFAQTLSLAEEYGISNTPIGRHGGKNWASIVERNLGRTVGLTRLIGTKPKIDLAVSHNSYTQALAAAWLRIPFVTLMDYEYQPLNHLCFRLAKRVIVPEAFPDDMLRKFGAAFKTEKYSGLKEEIYLADFQPAPGYLEGEDFNPDKIIIVVRPPAPWAAYHRFENTLFDDVIWYLADFSNAIIIFLPRITPQGEWANRLGIGNLVVPTKILNGPNLLYSADLVISAGGTMNREAAVLGTPAYTIFKGKMGAADRSLIDSGRMKQISTVADMREIRIEKRSCPPQQTKSRGDLLIQVTDLILGAM